MAWILKCLLNVNRLKGDVVMLTLVSYIGILSCGVFGFIWLSTDNGLISSMLCHGVFFKQYRWSLKLLSSV